MKPHKHCEVIKAWAEGSKVQGRFDGIGEWVDCEMPSWNHSWEYRIKPLAPKWPETTLQVKEMMKVWDDAPGINSAYIAVANLALSHALETGQVILPPNKDSHD